MGVESKRTLFRDPQCQRNAQQVIRENRVKSFVFKLRQSCLDKWMRPVEAIKATQQQ